MKAIVTRQSGETGVVDIYPACQSVPTEVLETEILKTFNSFEGVKSNPFISVKILRKQKPPESKTKNNFIKMA